MAESVANFTTEAERWRNVFLAVLGHDLRGPLNAVLLTSEVLSTLGTDARTSAVAELMKSGLRMRELLDSLLDYSRSSLGQGIVISKQAADLAAECAEELETLRASLPGRDIGLSVTGNTSGMFDGSRVREALSNLVTNAAHHGAPNSPIRVALIGSDDGVRLSVENEGTTIPPPCPSGAIRTVASRSHGATRHVGKPDEPRTGPLHCPSGFGGAWRHGRGNF